VDWYIEVPGTSDAVALRREVAAYLARHADADADLPGAELIAGELLANAVVHTGGPVWASLTWTDEYPVLRVADLGAGFELSPALPVEPTALDGRGLYLVSHLAKELQVSARRGGGAVISAVLPVRRAPERSYDPPRSRQGVLPSLAEARPEGGFGKEAFLRALVVQLAQAVESNEGPEAAEAAVAQVGVDVGGQMEAEFRSAREVVQRLSPEVMGECLVRLKHAIDGGFAVEEVTADRIVLTNTRCPFGEAVRAAPSLCRMTSSVFGGIAARNGHRGAAVSLEERIAVGDPGCRVVVWLDAHHPEAPPWAHRYRSAGD
jgi:anti-sigma regulatory factor (Ser/Thr protein kinase)